MKRFLTIIFTVLLLVNTIAFSAGAWDPRDGQFKLRSMDITITNDRTFKIGESVPSGELESLKGWNVSFTTGSGSTEFTYCPTMAGNEVPQYGSKFEFKKNINNNNGYFAAENTLTGVLRFECYLNEGQRFTENPNKPHTITINGIARQFEEGNQDMAITLENTNETKELPEGVTLYRYILNIPFSIPWNLPDNPVYRFHLVDNPALHEPSLDAMPLYAEAGAKIGLPTFNANNHLTEVVGVTVNGKEYLYGEYFTMPAEDVYFDAIFKGAENQTVVSDVKINLDFKQDDIYYGRVLPTTKDLKNALSFSSSVKGAGLYLEMADVDYMFDETFGEPMKPWVGNTWISFVIRCKNGYTFCNPSITDLDESVKWINDNVKVTINGKRNYYGSREGDVYYDGYFAASYLLSDTNGIEIHIRWYGGKELDIDTSNCRAGDTVTIPANSFNYDGYIPYRYDYTYTDPSGIPQRVQVTGNSFTYPQTNGDPVVIYAIYIRGEDDTIAHAVTEDAGEKISLDTGNSGFPGGTIVSANLVQSKEKGGAATIQHVKTALAGHATDCLVFDISASSFNKTVQPDGTVLIRFPVPAGYKNDHIDFCYIAEDGTMERIPMQVENGQCTAVLEHFSLYAIAKTVNKTEHQAHIAHTVSKVEAKAPTCTEGGSIAYYTCTCGKWFSDAAAAREITDKESVKLPAVHTDENGDQVCDLCGESGVEVPPSQPSEPDVTEPSDNTISGTVPGNNGAENTPKAGNSDLIIWIIAAAVVLAAAGVTVTLIIIKRKKK